MGRTPCCSKEGLNRGPWTPAEDSLLVNYIKAHGEGQWRSLPKKAGLLRCGKSCRLRWMNYLRPHIKRGNITADEEDVIIRLQSLLGNRWSLIAKRIPGRTDNEIKNYWNTHLRKKLKSPPPPTPPPADKNMVTRNQPKITAKLSRSRDTQHSEQADQNQIHKELQHGKAKEAIVYIPKPVRVSCLSVKTRKESSDTIESALSSRENELYGKKEVSVEGRGGVVRDAMEDFLQAEDFIQLGFYESLLM